MSDVSYELLGPLRVSRHGHEVDLGGRKQRAVLAALLLTPGRVVSTDRLIDTVWNDDPPPSAMSSLQAYISHLRRVLRDTTDATSPIVRRAPGYLLDVDPADVDVTAFLALTENARDLVRAGDWTAAVTAAEQALALCHGPVLADLADEEWVRVAAAPLEERRTGCERDLVTGLLGTGRAGDALAVAARLTSSHPLDEQACWLQAVALHRVGRTADGLGVLRAFHDLLGEELGLDPGPAIRDLQTSLLQQDPEIDHWPGAGGGPVAEVAEVADVAALVQPGASADTADALIGRSVELDVVRQAWAAAAHGASPWLVLSGPPGIGKSRLAREATSLWPGHLVSTVCPEDAGLPTWWPLRQIVRDLGGRPEVVLQSVGAGDADSTRFAVYEQVAELLRERAAVGPLLVHLEDVQWADPSTLGLLTHLVTTVYVPGLAVVITSRSDFAAGDGAVLMTAVDRRDGSQRLLVPPLSTGEVGELAARVSGEPLEPRQLDELAARTGGNPFFVSEYARLSDVQREEQVPDGVRLVLARRLAAFPSDVLVVLQVAAVAGEVLDLDVLKDACDLTNDQLADLLDIAADEDVVVAGRIGGGYSFVHALLREALVASLPASRLRATHLQVAQALRPRSDPGGLALRATHLVAAGSFADPADVVDACCAVALDAQDRWSPDESAQWWEAALEVHDARVRDRTTDRDRLVAGLIEAWVRGGHGQRMLDLVESSLDGAWRGERRRSVGLFAAMLSRLTGAWPWIAYGSDPGPLLARLEALAPLLEDDPSTLARVLGALAIGNCYHLDASVPDRLSRHAVDLAEGTGDPSVLADALLARCMTFAGVAERAQECLDLLDRLGGLDHPQRELDRVISHGVASMATMVLGDMEATGRHLRSGVALATQMRLPVSLAQLQWGERAVRLWTATDASELGGDLDAAFAAHAKTDLSQSVTLILAQLTLRWEQGRLAEGVDVDNPFLAPWVDAITAAARWAPDARALVTSQVLQREPVSWTSHGRLTLLAHAAADLGMVELVPDLVAGLTPVSGMLAAIGHTGIVGPVDLAVARLEALRGDVVAARRHLAAALEISRSSGGVGSMRRCEALALELDRRR